MVLKGRRVGGATLRVGLSTWGNASFRGTIYPAQTPRGSFLREYGGRFDTVELSSTHYALPSAEQMARWQDEVPAAFRFAVKFPQAISHGSRLVDCAEATRAFLERTALLGPALGPRFLQLPPDFGPSQLPVLETFLRGLPTDVSIAVELRHGGWFNRPEGARVWDLLSRRGWCVVCTDTMGRRDVVHARLTATTAFVRFVAVGEEGLDRSRAAWWGSRIGQWFSDGLDSAFVFIHEQDPRRAVDYVETVERFAGTIRSRKLGDSRRQLELEF